MNRTAVIVGVAVIVVIFIGTFLALLFSGIGPWGRTEMPGHMGPYMRGPGGELTPTEFKDNGERIYYTDTDVDNQRINFSDGPEWLKQADVGCVVCHGPNGTGGKVLRTDVTAPDIRYKTLTSKVPPYTDALIKRAITKGLDSSGKPLSTTMPRYQMIPQDVDDVLGYVKTLGKGS